jgi:23S rRNA (cytidine1920-2'-O)/16S rRNA (cytidine1409-2'-O)-methyltransferase
LPSTKGKVRLDQLLIQKGIVQNLDTAKAIILSGYVTVDGKKIDKVGTKVPLESEVIVSKKFKRYLGRGSWKLKSAFESFYGIDANLENTVCLDLGASTGGFTEVLLEKNAKMIYAIDVGYGQILPRLRNNAKVEVLDRTHVGDLSWSLLQIEPCPLFVTIDLSFISLTRVFPILRDFFLKTKYPIEGMALVKPQFEVDPQFLENGILRSQKEAMRSILKVGRSIYKNGGHVRGVCPSSITGRGGNQEYFLRFLYFE